MGFLTIKERYGIIIMENRYIVLQYDREKSDLAEIHDIHHAVTEIAKQLDMKVITIPSSIHWMEMTREELEQVKGIIDWILEKKNDTDSETGAGS